MWDAPKRVPPSSLSSSSTTAAICPHYRRLENWAMALSTAKRALVARIKAEASPELAGAHLRYLGRGGTWECLLLHMTRQVEAAEVERERAVALLRGQHPSKATVGPPLAIGNTASTRASSLSSSQKRQRQRQRYSGDSGSPIGGTQAKAWGPDSRQFPGKSFAGSPGQADVLWAGGKGGRRRSRSRSDALQDARLKGVVGERTLRCLHPWVVSLLKTSGIQFVPSVPTKHRCVPRQNLYCYAVGVNAEFCYGRRNLLYAAVLVVVSVGGR